ncbi:MAG: NADH-quinone oxidoreductase subunit N [Verrucomicrobiales bacterium]|nr:NADH-quinone oxidoreductase subunit N [Verrucomicrobiales bacterium]
MNASLLLLEIAVAALGLGLLLADLWTPTHLKRSLGYAAALGLTLILLGSFALGTGDAFGKMYVLDGLALFFKRFFLLAAVIVLLISVEFSDRIQAGHSEFYALVLFALCGMLFAASANDFVLVFVSLELITITFYVLNSFQRARMASLEAGVKYLILGALSTAFTVYGIALIFGTTGQTNFAQIAAVAGNVPKQPVFLLGLLMVLVGLGFKIAAFPFQIWAPDVYQGSPTPATAFLAVGSKAAGIVLLIRVLFSAVPAVTAQWSQLLMVISAVTILYGNLCAIPQRNLKRLLGYSSIAHAGYLLLGVAAMNAAGSSAILYYLSGYLFTLLAAFMVIALVTREAQDEDITALAGLFQRSPLLATALTLSMVSLAGIPPLAGFFGKFLLIRAVLERGALQPASYWLIGVALVGVVISFYYYLGVVRAIFWSAAASSPARIEVSWPSRAVLLACVLGMFYLGLLPNRILEASSQAVKVLSFAPNSRSAVAVKAGPNAPGTAPALAPR